MGQIALRSNKREVEHNFSVAGYDPLFPRRETWNTPSLYDKIQSTLRHRRISNQRDSLIRIFPILVASLFAQLPYEQQTGSEDALYELDSNAEVAALRDEYGADLVQLVGQFYDYCGIA